MVTQQAGYDTDEDEDLSQKVLAGCIDITDDEVLVQHHQPSDSIEDAFWSRASALILNSVCSECELFTSAHVERLYDLLSSHTMDYDVRLLMDNGHARHELKGSGLTISLDCEVYLDDDGYRSGNLLFSVWIRMRPHNRLPTRSSPVGRLRFD